MVFQSETAITKKRKKKCHVCGSCTIVGLVPCALVGICRSKIFSHGYFVGPNVFLVGILCVPNFFSRGFHESETFLVGILWVETFLVYISRVQNFFWSVFRGSNFFSWLISWFNDFHLLAAWERVKWWWIWKENFMKEIFLLGDLTQSLIIGAKMILLPMQIPSLML